eukprot:67535-Alexandrium_andersonii.AAC.1
MQGFPLSGPGGCHPRPQEGCKSRTLGPSSLQTHVDVAQARLVQADCDGRHRRPDAAMAQAATGKGG